MTPGQAAYNADLIKTPCYQDGGKRNTWWQLSPLAQCVWERDFKKEDGQ